MSLINKNERKKYVGASEVACLLGMNPYKSKWQLWMEKAGRMEEANLDHKLSVQIGIQLEPFVAEWWSRSRGRAVRRATEYLTHPTIEGAGASLDYYIDGDEPEILEVKVISTTSYEREWQDEPAGAPMRYLLQAQYQMALASAERCHLVAAVVGRQDLVDVTVVQNTRVQQQLFGEVERFWASIRDDDPPAPDFEREIGIPGAAAALVRDLEDKEVGAPPDIAGDLKKYHELSAHLRHIGKEKRELSVKIQKAMVDTGATCLLSHEGYRAKLTKVAPRVQAAYDVPAHVKLYVRPPRVAKDEGVGDC